MIDARGTIFIIDDDASVREALSRLLRSAGFESIAFASAHEFLAATLPDGAGCIVLDVVMPGMDGLELHDRMFANGLDYPAIYLSGNATVPISVRAMKTGAVDFLEKPVDQDVLIPLVEKALSRHREQCIVRDRAHDVRLRYNTLSNRELEVMRHVIRGRLNKQIASDLAIALKTVKVHRGRVMTKMGVRSVAELVRLCDAIGVTSAGEGG
jgi:FixJ family two-component response regulator